MEDDEYYWKLKDNIPLTELKKYNFKKRYTMLMLFETN